MKLSDFGNNDVAREAYRQKRKDTQYPSERYISGANEILRQLWVEGFKYSDQQMELKK
jgi:hypothetical protein